MTDLSSDVGYCTVMACPLRALNREHHELPGARLQLSGDMPVYGHAGYDAEERVICVSTYHLALVHLSIGFWLLVLLHEYRHHQQYHARVFPKTVLSSYHDKLDSFVAMERDADDWAVRQFRRRCPGTRLPAPFRRQSVRQLHKAFREKRTGALP